MTEDGSRCRLAILAFHKIGEPAGGAWPTWNYVPTARFAEYLGILRETGWQTVDLPTVLEGLVEPDRLPERAALVTFDDGYRSVLTEAVPVLRRFGYPAVIFVPTAVIGGANSFDRDVEPEEAICGWDELRELNRLGVSVQAHGASHRAFSALDRAELIEELAASKAALEARLDRPVAALAYPYGDDKNGALDAALLTRLGYRAAFLYGGGPFALPAPDRFRLTRLAMGPDSDLEAMLAEG